MQVTFCCPKCEQTNRAEVSSETPSIACRSCRAVLDVRDSLADQQLKRCLICHSEDLFARKDFPQRLGVLLVVIGFIASAVAWYYYRIILAFGILFATAGIDVLLYLVMREAVVCYRCHAHYRGVKNPADHPAFDLEIHERYRQIAARRAEQQANPSSAEHPRV